MRRSVALLLSLALLLTGCGGGSGADVTAGQLARAAVASQDADSGLEEQTREQLEIYLSLYGLQAEDYTDAAVYAAAGMEGREVAVIQAAAGGAERVAQGLEEYRRDRQAAFFGYLPEQEALLGRARVVRVGEYVALLACDDPEAAQAALLAACEGETADVFTPSAAPSATPAAEGNGFLPMKPPGTHDMTCYDTAAIRAAWSSGDESGLGEKDRAILARCREAMEERVTEGMTDFQKEVALHEWLLDNVDYDYDVYEPGSEPDRSDNNNPYGALVNGRAICLGFASTFQLLLELAEVECLTVVGSSGGKRDAYEDHAWNMVRLEGEWYGIDPTWNEGNRNSGYRYFNVTSDFLRETDHQWDYESIPEGTATRFHWDGKSTLPE